MVVRTTRRFERTRDRPGTGILQAVERVGIESGPAEAVLPPVGRAADGITRDWYINGGAMKSETKNISATNTFAVVMCAALVVGISGHGAAAELPANRFVKVADNEIGGHFFSQVVYAPPVKAFVSWGTQTHQDPIRTHETRHFLLDENRWRDALPPGREDDWAGSPRSWPDWNICATAGEFYERDGVEMPRPTNTFHQICWDEHRERLLFYVASMTFSYDPVRREWKQIHGADEKRQPPALLLWSSLCYDPVNKQVILFGGGGVDRPDGRPHTWAFDVTTDTWRPLESDIEPPPRCNSRMVYDRNSEMIVLFGGDGQDRGLADTWVFDVDQQQWQQRRPARSPPPRHGHGMAYLDGAGKVLLVGGNAVADYRDAKRLSRQVWVYDTKDNTWTPLAAKPPEVANHQWLCLESISGTNEAIAVVTSKYEHSQRTYRFRYEEPAPGGELEGVPPGTVAYKTERTKRWYEDQPPADRQAHQRRIAGLTANTWGEMKPPKSTTGRTWGTAIFDTDRAVAMKWGGGHSGYQGTDMAFYDVAANRFTIDRTPAFTPDPFDRWARRPGGRTFFNQPWTRHMRHTGAYDRVRKLGVFTDVGGSAWYDREADETIKHTWLYDPAQREWLEPIPQPFPGGGSVSPIALPTPEGVAVYQHEIGRTWEDSGRMYRFVGEAGKPDTWGWEEIDIVGNHRPYQREHMTIVYDQKRDRLIFLSHDRETREPELWFFGMDEHRWVKNPRPAPGGVSTREAVYVPGEDAVLAYGPARDDDPTWTRVYLCEENRWVPLQIDTPQFTVHEVALVYDPTHEVAVLLWPPSFERDIRPHLLRLDVSTLQQR
ncbi:MAG: Kelch repeat-containing protein [Planctomycetota bacterium]